MKNDNQQHKNNSLAWHHQRHRRIAHRGSGCGVKAASALHVAYQMALAAAARRLKLSAIETLKHGAARCGICRRISSCKARRDAAAWRSGSGIVSM